MILQNKLAVNTNNYLMMNSTQSAYDPKADKHHEDRSYAESATNFTKQSQPSKMGDPSPQ